MPSTYSQSKFVFCEASLRLDVSVRAQVLNLMKDLQAKYNSLYVCFQPERIRYICDRIAVMYLGKMVEIADREEFFARPLHPYTEAPLSAIPVPDVNVKRERIILKGDVPSPYNPPAGCKFHNRCSKATKFCAQVEPELTEVEAGHFAACHLYSNPQEMKG